MTDRDRLHTEIEQRLAGILPEVELLACEHVATERLRLFIDHPDGVSLALCEQVTRGLSDLLAAYGLEVSSPGPERPLTKPHHFRRFLGRRARVRTRRPLLLGRSGDRSSSDRAPDPDLRSADPSSSGRAPDRDLLGPKSFTGELVGATDDEVTVAVDAAAPSKSGEPETGVISIPYAEISRSNLLERRGEEKR